MSKGPKRTRTLQYLSLYIRDQSNRPFHMYIYIYGAVISMPPTKIHISPSLWWLQMFRTFTIFEDDFFLIWLEYCSYISSNLGVSIKLIYLFVVFALHILHMQGCTEGRFTRPKYTRFNAPTSDLKDYFLWSYWTPKMFKSNFLIGLFFNLFDAIFWHLYYSLLFSIR